MTQAEENQMVAATLLEISKALVKVDAAGPTGYWNVKLAESLNERAKEITEETRRSLR